MKKFLSVLIIACLMLTLAACGGQGGSDGGSSDGSGSGMAATPQFVWRMQSVHNSGESAFQQHVETAERIYQASNGRLKIEVHPNGTFASSTEAFQACGDGVFEMHCSWPTYIKGINNAFVTLTMGNMAMDPIDKWIWLYEYDGWDIFQEAFDEVNLQFIAAENCGSEVLLANEAFHSIEDMSGKKFRATDSRLFEKFGIAGISLPLEEVFTGLTTGAVDAAEFNDLKADQGLGLLDVTDYAIYPDFWNSGSVTAVVVNKDAWNSLPADLQLIVEMAFKANEIQHYAKGVYESAVVMKELQESGEIDFIRLPAEEMAELRAKTYEIEQNDIAQYGGLTEKTYASYYEFLETWYPYKSMSAWWGIGLTPEQQLGYTP